MFSLHASKQEITMKFQAFYFFILLIISSSCRYYSAKISTDNQMYTNHRKIKSDSVTYEIYHNGEKYD